MSNAKSDRKEFTIALTAEEIEDLRLGLALLVGECPPDQSPEPIHRLADKLAAALTGEDSTASLRAQIESLKRANDNWQARAKAAEREGSA